ncbi:hypothetical protein SAMN05192559_104233 [Halobacillus karajensis]|nr:hypothetical protein SAMN05192559_104233 [Halobacillus karajensis]
MVTIEELVPEDHLFRKIDPYISEDNGRPALDPLVLFHPSAMDLPKETSLV